MNAQIRLALAGKLVKLEPVRPDLTQGAMPEEFPDLGKLEAMDEMAWAQAVDAFRPIAFHVATGCGLDGEDAKETFQDALMDLKQIVQSGKLSRDASRSGVEGLKALVAVITRRRASDRKRRNLAEKRGVKRTESLEQIEGSTGRPLEARSATPTPLDDLERVELVLLLRAALQSMGEETRNLLEGKFLGGKTNQELSQEFGLRPGTVGSTIFRGLSKIRKSLTSRPKLMQQLRDYLR